ncbi:TRAP transporter substrate-binding protein DctP [Chloroflexota bacterium]
MKKVIYCFVASVLLAGLFLGCTSAPPETIELKAMSAFPQTVVYTEPLNILMEEFNKRAAGKAVMNWVGGPEAIPAFEQLDPLGEGVFDILYSSAGYHEGKIGEISSFRIIPRPSAAEERKIGYYDYMNSKFQERNVYFLGRADDMGYVFYTTKPVPTLADFKGLRIRSSATYVALLKALGAEQIVIALPETFSALERGLVDGLGLPDLGVIDYGFVDAVKYYIVHPYMVTDGALFMNLDTWNGLPKDLQKLLTDIVIEIETDMPNRHRRLLAKEEAGLREAGVEFIEFSPAEEQQYLKMANESAWARVKEVAPQSYDKIRQLLGQ